MRTHLLAITAILALQAATAFGQLTWGVNGLGGSGTWNTSTLNWWNGSANVAWPSGGQAIFDGTPGAVAVSSVTASKLTFNVPGYVLQPTFLNGSATGLTVEANADATISSYVFGRGGSFIKNGAGTLAMTDSLVFFNQVAINAGELKFAGSSTGDSGALYSLADAPGVVMTLGRNGLSPFFVGGLAGGGANGGIVRPDDIAGTQTLYVSNIGGTFAGTLQDNGAGILALNSSGPQEFTAVNTYSGATTVSAGTLTFRQSGTALNSPLKITGGTLRLDNTALNVADRISDILPITVAGTLTLRGNATAPSTEILGPLRFAGTLGIIDVSPSPAQPAAFVFDSLAPRAAGESGVLYFQGSGLGSAAGPGVASVRFTNAPALVGGSGGDGTASLSIVPAAFAVGVSGTTFVTYGSNGIRPLSDVEYSGDLSGAGVFGNVGVGTAFDIAGPVAVNALRLKAGGTISGAGTLAIGSAMILAQPGSGPITVGTLDFGGAGAIIKADSDLVISSSLLGSNTENGLTKIGAGRLTLTGLSNYTGATNVIGGVLAATNLSALGDAVSPVIIQSGAALDLLGGIVVNSKRLTLAGSGPDGLGSLRIRTGDNLWNGPVTLQSVTLNVGAGSLTFGGMVALSGSLTKTGGGSLVFGGGTDGSMSGMTILGGPLVSHASSGVPFTLGQLALYGTPVTFSPAGAGADVMLGAGGFVSSSTRGVFSFNQGSTSLLLDKGANNSLTLIARSGSVPVFARGGKATLVIAAGGGISALGVSERFKSSFSSPSAIPSTNGIISSAIVGQDNDANRSADFLTYDASTGLRKATYSTLMTLPVGGSSVVFNATSPQTLTGNAGVYALKNSGQTINLNGKILTLGDVNNGGVFSKDPAGLILNGGSITSGTIEIAKTDGSVREVAIYTSLAGGLITSKIAGLFSSTAALTKFGPGLLNLTGNVTGSLTVNSGGVQIGGLVSGSVILFGDAALSGTGRANSAISGGHTSPGDSAGIFTAAAVSPSALSVPTSSGNPPPISFPPGLPSFTAFDFEFTRLGTPTFNTPAASGNDILRLTDPTAPFGSALAADNEIAVYFNLAAGVHLGDTFFGGFFTDKNAPFDGSILGATWRVFLADPLGDVDFNGTKYRASADGLAVSTVPQSANFGAGNVNGYITRVTVVPEPGVAASLLAGMGALLGGGRRGRRNGAGQI